MVDAEATRCHAMSFKSRYSGNERSRAANGHRQNNYDSSVVVFVQYCTLQLAGNEFRCLLCSKSDILRVRRTLNTAH